MTCVLTGNEDGEIDISCFQISNVGVAMARDGILEASVDPSLMRVVKSSPSRYVPEVFYKYKNAYGLMVQEAAKPTFPVEYLIVTVLFPCRYTTVLIAHMTLEHPWIPANSESHLLVDKGIPCREPSRGRHH